MDPKFIKSCKYCLALSFGIILGMIIMNELKDPIIKKNEECECKK